MSIEQTKAKESKRIHYLSLSLITLIFFACESVTLTPADPIMRGDRDQGTQPELPLAGAMSAGETPAGETPAGEAPAGETPAGETPAGETSAGETPAGETPAGETPAGETSAGETPAGDEFMLCGEVTEQAIEATLPIDIVWVIDSSPSMGEEIAQVQANLNTFTARIGMAGLDVRVALVASEADTVTPDRDYLGVCIPPPLSAADSCPDVDSEIYKHIRLNVHSSDPLSKMIEAAPQLNGFFRDNALKHIVFVTDDDAGWGMDADEFMMAIGGDPNLRGATVHSVVDLIGYMSSCVFDDNCSCGDERGETYIDLSERTSGGVFSVCEEDWAPLFTLLEERVTEGTELPCSFAFPQDTRSVMFSPDEVNVYWTPVGEAEGVVPRVDNEEDCGDQEGWYYDDPMSPSWITLCPASCGETQGEVRFEFGCMVVKR